MGLGLLAVVFALFDYIPDLVAVILERSITYLNGIIKWIASFEGFVIKDIPMNFSLLASAYLLIIAWAIWFKKPGFKQTITALIGVLILQLSYITVKNEMQGKQEWIVFHRKKQTIITRRNGKNVVLYKNLTGIEKPEEDQMLNTYLVANFCKIGKREKFSNVQYFKSNKILILDRSGIYPAKANPDIVLLTASPKINLERLLLQYKPKMVIADGSNYRTYVMRWKQTCVKQKIPFHATAEKGFYRLE